MRARLTKLGAVLTALAALAVGGAALASASHKASPPVTATSPGTAEAQGPDTDNLQQGDQSGTDAAAGVEAASDGEQQSGESSRSDGPGGYADTSPNADTQQEGEH